MPPKYFIFTLKSMLVLSVLLFFERGYAQKIPVNRSHSIHTYHHGQNGSDIAAATGNLTVLAVMVEFQADDNRFTSGTGRFGTGGSEGIPYLANNTITIDPLPHDQDYFEAHLEFAKNYFETVSGGNLSLEYRVLPTVFRLDRPMEAYSPTGREFTGEKLAVLARDVWQKVEEDGGFDTAGLDPQNTAFVIFHAGVGRDIELTGTTLDKTPQDIPSIYLGTNSLSRLLDDTGFDGFPVNDGTFKISNSLILPRTLSRRGEDVGGSEFVLQLSTNGLICASIGSHLGLPDLFDPETGSSGIGRFGLMDGAGIFSYSGLFPPEPSAWEKIYLGWLTPYEVVLDSGTPYPLAAVSLRQEDFSVAKYSISSKEYFLLENRHRDPNNDGVTLTVRGKETVTQTFTNRDEAFVFQQPGFEELLAPGVVVDVSDFDWSLPGGPVQGSEDRFLNGGILIWHVDEAVIDRQRSGRGVNADPDRRGVDLEEADGAQDIGRESQNIILDRSIGSAFDFWWKGNNSSVITAEGDTLSLYQNRFGPSTHPNSNSNSGGATFLEFSEFSENSTVATFMAHRAGDSDIKKELLAVDLLPDERAYNPVNDPHLTAYPLGLTRYAAPPDSFLIVPTQNTVFALRLNLPINPLFDFQIDNPRQPLVGQTIVLGARPGEDGAPVNLENWSWADAAWQNRWNNSGTAARGFMSSLDGTALLLDFTRQRFDLGDGSRLADLASPEMRTATAGGSYATLSENGFKIIGTQQSIPVNSGDNRLYAGALQLTQNESAFYLLEDKAFYLIEPEAADPKRLLFESESMSWPAFADFDRDGRLDFLYSDQSANTLKAVNINGGLLASFPVPAPRGSRFMGTPLVADLDGDRSLDLVITVQDSVSMNLYAYNSSGEIKPGFPLYVGGVSDPANRPVNPLITDNTLYALSHDGDVKAWKFPELTDIRWGSQYGNEPFYNKVTGHISGSEPPTEIPSALVKSETYNWPNPAKDETYIRYQTDGPGKVEVRIINMSGRLVLRRDYEASGGAPEEQRIETSQWESGVYLAKITAKINGRESSKLVRIAVVH